MLGGEETERDNRRDREDQATPSCDPASPHPPSPPHLKMNKALGPASPHLQAAADLIGSLSWSSAELEAERRLLRAASMLVERAWNPLPLQRTAYNIHRAVLRYPAKGSIIIQLQARPWLHLSPKQRVAARRRQ